MDGTRKKQRKITLSVIDRYVIGAICLFFGAAEILVTNYISGLFFILAAIVTMKQTIDYVEERLNFSLSTSVKFFVVFCSIVAAFASVPHVTPAAGSGNEAIGASSDSIGTQLATTLDRKLYTSNVDRGYYRCSSWSNEQYPVIGLFGENYVPLLENSEKIWNNHINKLARLVLNNCDNYTIRNDEILNLGEGYTLKARQINVDGQKVWLEFRHNGKYVDDEIISASNSSGSTWKIELDNIQGENDIIVFRVHINQIYFVAADGIAQIDGLWLIDYANAGTFKTGDRFGNYRLKEINRGEDVSNLGCLFFEQDDT